jgi:D-3-phosphoglycerate dehydrogenase
MNIVLCYPVTEKHLRQIASVAPDAKVINASQEEIPEAIFEADIFCGHAKQRPVAWDQVVQQGRLRWIQSSAAGMDHCLTPSVIESEIVVASASGLFADQVAEQTLALLLGVLRSLSVFFRAELRREFIRRPTGDLHGKTVGILGFGGNGRRIAEVLQPFRVRVLATDVYPIDRPDYVQDLLPPEETDRVLSGSDVIILCVPLNSQTHGMISSRELARMKPGSVLINVARGPVVIESDLVDALRSGHLGGAGLDVTEVEPLPTDSPLWEMSNVLITPHVGAQSERRYDDVTDFFCRNLKRYLSGKPLLNHLVDKELGFPRPSEAAWALNRQADAS